MGVNEDLRSLAVEGQDLEESDLAGAAKPAETEARAEDDSDGQPEDPAPHEQKPTSEEKENRIGDPEELKKVLNSMYARQRILERERDALYRKLTILAERVQSLNQRDDQEDSESRDYERDDERDNDYSSEIQRLKKELEATKANYETKSAAERANMAIRQYLSANPHYQHAAAYYAASLLDEILDDHPELTHAEAEAAAVAQIEQLKVKMISEGKNPAEYIYRRALRRGYQPPRQQQPASSPQPQQQKHIVVDEKREAAKKSARSIQGVASSPPPNKISVETVAKMSDEDFLDWVKNIKRGNSFSVSEILKGKVKEGIG